MVLWWNKSPTRTCDSRSFYPPRLVPCWSRIHTIDAPVTQPLYIVPTLESKPRNMLSWVDSVICQRQLSNKFDPFYKVSCNISKFEGWKTRSDIWDITRYSVISHLLAYMLIAFDLEWICWAVLKWLTSMTDWTPLVFKHGICVSIIRGVIIRKLKLLLVFSWLAVYYWKKKSDSMFSGRAISELGK